MPERAALGASDSPVFMAFPKLACGISAAEPRLNVLLEKAIIVQEKLKKTLNEIESKQVLCRDAVQHYEVPVVTHAHTYCNRYKQHKTSAGLGATPCGHPLTFAPAPWRPAWLLQLQGCHFVESFP